MEKELQTFLAERPAINKSAFAKELMIDRMTLEKILICIRKIPKAKRGIFLNIMQKYGYEIKI